MIYLFFFIFLELVNLLLVGAAVSNVFDRKLKIPALRILFLPCLADPSHWSNTEPFDKDPGTLLDPYFFLKFPNRPFLTTFLYLKQNKIRS